MTSGSLQEVFQVRKAPRERGLCRQHSRLISAAGETVHPYSRAFNRPTMPILPTSSRGTITTPSLAVTTR